MNCKSDLLLFASILVLASSGVECTPFQDNVKDATKNLGGINCLVDTALNVEYLANEFNYEIEICNVDQSTVVSKIVDYCESISRKTENLIDSDNNICRNAAYSDSDAKNTPPPLCDSAIRSRMDKLNEIVERTLKYVTNKENSVTDSCSKMAVTNLKLNLPSFAELVGECAKQFK